MSISLAFCDAEAGGASSVAVSGIVAEVSSEFASPRATSTPPPVVTSGDGDRVHSVMLVRMEEQVTWSHSKENEFSKLAALKARHKATPEQLAEFGRLLALRRRLKNPLSADEVIFQYQRREMESKLLNELQRYVAFLEAPRSPKAQAR